MATQVAGELYYDLDGQLSEIKRQLRQPTGYPYDPAQLKIALQNAIEGKFGNYLIDCDVEPFIPSGWSVEEHKKSGQFQWNPAKIELYLSAAQKKGSIEGNKLRKELAKKQNLNANVLDFLIANPNLIPEEWKGKAIFFWGTVYRDPNGGLYVRCLCWFGDEWMWWDSWLGGGWSDSSPAALLAS